MQPKSTTQVTQLNSKGISTTNKVKHNTILHTEQPTTHQQRLHQHNPNTKHNHKTSKPYKTKQSPTEPNNIQITTKQVNHIIPQVISSNKPIKAAKP